MAPHRLKPNSIGPWGLAALAIGITSPAMGLYALWGPMQTMAGPITPLIFLAAMLMTLPTAVSYALLNQEVPSAAAAAEWLWVAAHPLAGYQAGLLMTTYFLMAAVAQPLLFALFFADLLAILHVDLPKIVTLTIGVLVSTMPVAWACLRGAEASIKSTVRLMILETLVVVALSVTILVEKYSEASAINLSPFDPHNVTSPSGFWMAMILGLLAFCGFDVVSTAAEEANAPRQHLPKAILLTVVGIAVFWAVNAWVFTLSTPVEDVHKYTAEGLTAITPMAQAYWGWGRLVVILTALTGLTAVYISSAQGASRILFALARRELLPKGLARLAGDKRVPKNAVLAVLLTVTILDLASLYLFASGLDSFTWWANALVFFATLTFVSVNIANGLFFFRFARNQFSVVKNFLIPTAGVLLNAYLVYAGFFSALWAGSMRTGKSVVIGCVSLLAVQIIAVIAFRVCKPQLFTPATPDFDDDGPPVAPDLQRAS